MHTSNEELLTTKQAASYLKVSESFLVKERSNNASIPFIKLGAKVTRYRKSDLDQFINARVKKTQ